MNNLKTTISKLTSTFVDGVIAAISKEKVGSRNLFDLTLPPMPTIVPALPLSGGPFGKELRAAVKDEAPAWKVLSLLEAKGGLRVGELRSLAKLDAKQLAKALAHLRETKQIIVKGQKRGTTYYPKKAA
jgi:hypothetical protein